MSLKKLFDESELSLDDIIKHTGKSKPVVSKVINGKYDSANKEIIESSIRNYIIKNSANKTEFMTMDQKIAYSLLEDTKSGSEFSLLTGESGVGKTHVCKRFISRNSDVFYIKMRRNLTLSRMLDILLIKLGKSKTGTIDVKFQKLVDTLNDSNYEMVMIDEADLFTKDSDNIFFQKLEIFRELFEEGIGVTLVGLISLEDKLKEIGEAYITRRISWSYSMKIIKTQELRDFWQKVLFMSDSTFTEQVLKGVIHNGYFGTLASVSRRYKIANNLQTASQLVFNLRKERGK